jgi:hypothetical protein
MAARDFIKVARDQTAGTEALNLLQYKDTLQRALDMGRRLVAIARHNFDDGNPQAIIWTDFETLFGLPAGKGQAVFTLLDGSVGSMEGRFQTDAAKVLTETVG